MRKASYLIWALVLALGLVMPLAGCQVSGIGSQTALATAGPGRIYVDNIPHGGVTGGTEHGFCKPAKPYEWHFVITNLDPKEGAPAGVTAVFAAAGEVNIPLEKVTAAGVAHYTLEGYLDHTLIGAYADLLQQVTYTRFNLSHAPCASEPGPVVQHTIIASAGVGGSISPVGDVTVSHGGNQTFIITADTSYEINDVLVDGASVGAVSSYTFEGVISNHTIHADFKLIELPGSCYVLTLAASPAGGGTATDVTGAACYEEGGIVAIRALATSCYEFVSWTAPAGTLTDPYAAETSFTMPGQHITVTANFAFAGSPVRSLPDEVLPGEKFAVTVTFAGPSDGFHAIALTDIAPDGWEASVNVLWADPEATAVNTPAAEAAAYVWYGPYDMCTPFRAVYEVRVPVNAEPGTYTFGGSLKYYVEANPAPPYEQEIRGDMEVRVGVGETVRITGVTREVDGAVLAGATVVLYQNGEPIGSVTSDQSGRYQFEFSQLGDYEVAVSKSGFREEVQSISVAALAIYTLDFVGDHGLIPEAPTISYVLACISLWKFGEPPSQLSTSRVLQVISAWLGSTT